MRNKSCISALKTWLSSAFLLLSLFFAQAVNAADYYWLATDNSNVNFTIDPNKRHLSAAAACQYYVSSFKNNSSLSGHSYRLVMDSGSASARCYINLLHVTAGVIKDYFNLPASRRGDSCPNGSTFDPATGECKGDPCLSTVGVPGIHRHRIGDFTGTGQIGARTEPPGVVCQSSCQFAWDQQAPSKLVRFQSGNPNGVFGDFRYIGNGVTCQSGTPGLVSPSSSDPSKNQSKTCTNKVTDSEGRVSYSCTENSQFKNPGEMNCGSVNGGPYTCTPRENAPQFEDKTIKKDFENKTNSDGSKTDTTTTTTTTTTCVGANACTTTTTVHTGTKGTNADGSSGSSGSTCTGPGCAGDSDDGSEPPKDEEKECDPATDPNKCGQSSVSGEACDVSVNCSGDAVQCAILRKQKEQTCADEDFREVTPDKVSQLKSNLDAEFSGDSYQPLVADASNTFDFASTIDTTSRFSKSCPVVPDISAPWFEGQTLTIELSDMISQFCDFLIWFGYLLVAFAMRAAAQIIANGMN